MKKILVGLTALVVAAAVVPHLFPSRADAQSAGNGQPFQQQIDEYNRQVKRYNEMLRAQEEAQKQDQAERQRQLDDYNKREKQPTAANEALNNGESPTNAVSFAPFGLLRRQPASPFVANGSESSSFAVVNLKRILDARHVTLDPETNPSSVLLDIQRIVAARAAAHGVAYVFDLSSQSDSGAPFILADIGGLDLTDEVLADLGK